MNAAYARIDSRQAVTLKVLCALISPKCQSSEINVIHFTFVAQLDGQKETVEFVWVRFIEMRTRVPLGSSYLCPNQLHERFGCCQSHKRESVAMHCYCRRCYEMNRCHRMHVVSNKDAEFHVPASERNLVSFHAAVAKK